MSVSLVVCFEHRSVEDQRQAVRKQAELHAEDPRIAYSMVHLNKPFRFADGMPAAEFHATRIYRELLQPIVTARSTRSAALLSISMRPSATYRVSAVQRVSA